MSTREKDSFEHLKGKEALKKMKELAEKCRTCMFVTDLQTIPSDARPMSLQEVCEKGSHWFLSGKDSHKNMDIRKDNRVQLFYQNNSNMELLSIYGEAFEHTDRATIDKYWTDFANAWFDGKDDPTLTVIEVRPKDVYYWDTKHGKTVAFAKMALSAFTPLEFKDDGVEGELAVKG